MHTSDIQKQRVRAHTHIQLCIIII